MSPFTLLALLLPFITLSWAQTNSSQLSPSVPSTTSSMASLNSTTSPSLTSSAQFPSLSGYSPCVTNCLAVGIARVNCTSITEVNCYCANSTFPAEIFNCIASDCPSELMTEEKLAQQFCNLASASPTLTFPSPLPSNTSSLSSNSIPVSSQSRSTPSATASASSGTMFNSAKELFGGFLAALIYTLCIYLL